MSARRQNSTLSTTAMPDEEFEEIRNARREKLRNGSTSDNSNPLVNSMSKLSDKAAKTSDSITRSNTNMERMEREMEHDLAHHKGSKLGGSPRSSPRSTGSPRLPRISSTTRDNIKHIKTVLPGPTAYAIKGSVSVRVDRVDSLITIVVVRASNLAAGDTNGKSDPYVKIYLYDADECQQGLAHDGTADASSSLGLIEHTKRKTEVIKRTLNPHFNTTLEPYDFKQMNIPIEKCIAQIEVWDWDRWDSNDFLGAVRISLDVASRHGELELNLCPYNAVKLFLLPDSESQFSPTVLTAKEIERRLERFGAAATRHHPKEPESDDGDDVTLSSANFDEEAEQEKEEKEEEIEKEKEEEGGGRRRSSLSPPSSHTSTPSPLTTTRPRSQQPESLNTTTTANNNTTTNNTNNTDKNNNNNNNNNNINNINNINNNNNATTTSNTNDTKNVTANTNINNNNNTKMDNNKATPQRPPPPSAWTSLPSRPPPPSFISQKPAIDALNSDTTTTTNNNNNNNTSNAGTTKNNNGNSYNTTSNNNTNNTTTSISGKNDTRNNAETSISALQAQLTLKDRIIQERDVSISLLTAARKKLEIELETTRKHLQQRLEEQQAYIDALVTKALDKCPEILMHSN